MVKLKELLDKVPQGRPPPPPVPKAHLPIDTTDKDAVFGYTDDLVYIHKELRRILRPHVRLRAMMEVDRLHSVFLALRDELHLLDWSLEAPYKIAHEYVIDTFYDMWRVLPNSELDDYRVFNAKPTSLSREFIAECRAGIVSACKAGKWDVRPRVDVEFFPPMASHAPSDAGTRLIPYWVSPLAVFKEEFPHRTHTDDDGVVEVLDDEDRLFEKGGNVYADVDILDIAWDPAWPIVWMTPNEIKSRYEERGDV